MPLLNPNSKITHPAAPSFRIPHFEFPIPQNPPRLRASAGNPSAIRHQPSVLGRSAAFTLIELLVVIAVIGILAGLTLAAMGGIQKRGAIARAESDIQALSTAIEEFHRDFGKYPEANSNSLYNELVGANAAINNIPGKTKVYFEPPPGIVGTNSAGKLFFQDPWGVGYFFETSGANLRNRGMFDIYSKAGGNDTSKFIRN